jgi:hypothetical protein
MAAPDPISPGGETRASSHRWRLGRALALREEIGEQIRERGSAGLRLLGDASKKLADLQPAAGRAPRRASEDRRASQPVRPYSVFF